MIGGRRTVFDPGAFGDEDALRRGAPESKLRVDSDSSERLSESWQRRVSCLVRGSDAAERE